MSALAERTNGHVRGGLRVVEEPRHADRPGASGGALRSRLAKRDPLDRAPRKESKRMRAGDGVVGAAGTIAGGPVYCYAQDQSFVGGSLGEAHADTIVRVMELAGRAGVP